MGSSVGKDRWKHVVIEVAAWITTAALFTGIGTTICYAFKLF